jgi:hypothetical protein
MKGILSRRKLNLYLLLFIVLFTAISNTFFSDFFTSPISGAVSLSQLVAGVFLLIFLNYNLKIAPKLFWKFNIPLLSISMFSLISAIWSPYPFLAIVFSFKLFFLINIFILSATLSYQKIFSENSLIKLTKKVILITIIGQIFGLYLGVNMYHIEYSSAGLSDNGSVIAAQMLFAVTALLLSGLNKKNNYLYFILILVSIFLTLRRSALFAYVLVFLVIFIVNFFSTQSKIKTKLKWFFFLLTSSIITSLIITNSEIGNALLIRLNELDPEKGGTASGRYEFQKLGWLYSINRDIIPFIFGDGFGASILVNLKNGFIPIGMHSDVLDVLIGLGFIGVTFMGIYFFKLYKMAKTLTINHNHYNSVIGFIVALVSIAVFTGGFFEPNTMLGYISIGFIYGNFKRENMNG